MVFSTNNAQFLKGAYRDRNPITYDKQSAPSQKFTHANIIKCDLRGFDTKVGKISNNSTTMFAMLSLFDKPQYKEQYEEIMERLKLQRKHIGSEIDKIKGTTPPNIPKSWSKFVKIYENDSDEVKSEKYKYNSMVISKKPYFFIYLYHTLYEEYKSLNRTQDQLCKGTFGLKLSELIKKYPKSSKEMGFVKYYNKQMPVLKTHCVMNNLCHIVENTDFDILYNPKQCSLLYDYVSDDFELDEDKYKSIIEIYKKYQAQKRETDRIAFIDILNDAVTINDDSVFKMKSSRNINILSLTKARMYEVCSNSKELFDYLMYISCKVSNFNYGFVWEILEEDILDIIKSEDNYIPVLDENGEFYLGSKYSLKKVGDDIDNI